MLKGDSLLASNLEIYVSLLQPGTVVASLMNSKFLKTTVVGWNKDTYTCISSCPEFRGLTE